MTCVECLMSAVAVILVWLLIVEANAVDERYEKKRGSICDDCLCDCPEGERLCSECRRRRRAKEIRGGKDV